MIQVVSDQGNHGRDQFRCVLIIRMDHDDNVASGFECQPITGFLITAIASVGFVLVHNGIRQIFCNARCFILTPVINNNDEIYNFLFHDLIICFNKRPLGIVCRHHHNDFFIFKHDCIVIQIIIYKILIIHNCKHFTRTLGPSNPGILHFDAVSFQLPLYC